MRCSERGGMALLGSCSRTIHATQRPQNTSFHLRKVLPAVPTSLGQKLRTARLSQGYTQSQMAPQIGCFILNREVLGTEPVSTAPDAPRTSRSFPRLLCT